MKTDYRHLATIVGILLCGLAAPGVLECLLASIDNGAIDLSLLKQELKWFGYCATVTMTPFVAAWIYVDRNY